MKYIFLVSALFVQTFAKLNVWSAIEQIKEIQDKIDKVRGDADRKWNDFNRTVEVTTSWDIGEDEYIVEIENLLREDEYKNYPGCGEYYDMSKSVIVTSLDEYLRDEVWDQLNQVKLSLSYAEKLLDKVGDDIMEHLDTLNTSQVHMFEYLERGWRGEVTLIKLNYDLQKILEPSLQKVRSCVKIETEHLSKTQGV